MLSSLTYHISFMYLESVLVLSSLKVISLLVLLCYFLLIWYIFRMYRLLSPLILFFVCFLALLESFVKCVNYYDYLLLLFCMIFIACSVLIFNTSLFFVAYTTIPYCSWQRNIVLYCIWLTFALCWYARICAFIVHLGAH